MRFSWLSPGVHHQSRPVTVTDSECGFRLKKLKNNNNKRQRIGGGGSGDISVTLTIPPPTETDSFWGHREVCVCVRAAVANWQSEGQHWQRNQSILIRRRHHTHTHIHLLFTAHFRALSIEQQQRTTLPLHVCLQVFSYTQWGIQRGPITRGDNKNIHRIESIANGPQRRPQQQKLAWLQWSDSLTTVVCLSTAF